MSRRSVINLDSLDHQRIFRKNNLELSNLRFLTKISNDMNVSGRSHEGCHRTCSGNMIGKNTLENRRCLVTRRSSPTWTTPWMGLDALACSLTTTTTPTTTTTTTISPTSPPLVKDIPDNFVNMNILKWMGTEFLYSWK